MNHIFRFFAFVAFILTATVANAADIRFETDSAGQHYYTIDGTEYAYSNSPVDINHEGTTQASFPPASVLDGLTPTERAQIANACVTRFESSESRCRNRFASDTAASSEFDDIRSAAAYEEAGGVALKLFNYAMGQQPDGTTTNTCLTCPFLGNFLIGLTNFSYATYLYFEAAFSTLVPLMMATWLGWKTIGLFFNGGEDGRTFISGVLKRLALFFVIWMAITVGNTSGSIIGPTLPGVHINNPKWAWDTAGPNFLKYAFTLSSEIRDNTIRRQGVISTDFSGVASYDAFHCVDVGDNVTAYTSDATIQKFATSALEVACATERVHMIGVSSAIAVLGSAVSQFSLWSGAAIGAAIVKLIAGFFMLFVFGLSAIWFTFLILDVAVRGLITAAFLPVIATMYLFEITRGFATNAVRAMAGALVTAVAISIVATLAYYLLTRTVVVYNAAFPLMGSVYGGDVVLTAIPTSDAINAFREFIVRIQETDTSRPQIPMDFSAPWFYYLILSSLALFSLGKKVIAMLESMIGAQGASAMADNAMRLSRTGLGLAMMAAPVAGAAAMFAGRGAYTGGGAALGFGAETLKQHNPFGNSLGGGGGMGAAAMTSSAVNMINSGAEPPAGQ